MKNSRKIFILLLVFLTGCISQFIPQTRESADLLIVEGLITDKQGINSIKLSKSMPLGTRSDASPVSGGNVTITDDLGSIVSLLETEAGTYVPPPSFNGVIGRFYTLHVTTYSEAGILNYESFPMKMKPVPPIDSVYYEKVTIQASDDGTVTQEGSQIYVNTHDATNSCRFYRWEYAETWEFEVPYFVPNRLCWVSDNSRIINIKSTSALEEDRINRYPLNFVSNQTDRLNIKYSILVNQYSLNEDEYLYWEKLQNIAEQVGGLYDMIPSSIPSNITCINDPTEKVLGYFSVSANASKRIFIKDRFKGLVNLYDGDQCIADTIFPGEPFPANLNTSAWIIIDNFMPPYWVITYSKGCYDCTVRGTNTEPDFWREDK